MLKPFYIKKKNITDRLAPEFLGNVKRPDGDQYQALVVNKTDTKWTINSQYESYQMTFVGSDLATKNIIIYYPFAVDNIPPIKELLSQDKMNYPIIKFGRFSDDPTRTFVLVNADWQNRNGVDVAVFGWSGISINALGNVEPLVGTLDIVAFENISVTKL